MTGSLIIISGPSGVGKTTICERLAERVGAFLSVSATTRPRRPGETEGHAYHFLSKGEFERRLENGDFLEYAQIYSGHYYGTPAQPVREALAAGRPVVLEIDIAGATQVMRIFPDAVSIYILPPTEEALQNRIRGRKQDSEEAIRERLEKAQGEIRQARESGAFRHFVVNNTIEQTVEDIVGFVRNK